MRAAKIVCLCGLAGPGLLNSRSGPIESGQTLALAQTISGRSSGFRYRLALVRPGALVGSQNMIFTESKLKGAFIIVSRGAKTARILCKGVLARSSSRPGLKPVIARANIGFHRRKGTAAACTSSFAAAKVWVPVAAGC